MRPAGSEDSDKLVRQRRRQASDSGQQIPGTPSQVLRLLAAEGMVALGKLSLDGTKLAGNAAHAANRTLPQIQKLLAEAAQIDAAEDAELGDQGQLATPQALARRGERRQRLARARDRLAGEDQARREAQRAKVEAWDAAAAAREPRGGQRPNEEPRANRAGTEPRANLTDPDVRIMRNKKGYVSGYNGQLVVTCALLRRDRILLDELAPGGGQLGVHSARLECVGEVAEPAPLNILTEPATTGVIDCPGFALPNDVTEVDP
jgi:hypothetical protein